MGKYDRHQKFHFLIEDLEQKCPKCGKFTKDCSGFTQELLKWMRQGYAIRDAYKKALEEVNC